MTPSKQADEKIQRYFWSIVPAHTAEKREDQNFCIYFGHKTAKIPFGSLGYWDMYFPILLHNKINDWMCMAGMSELTLIYGEHNATAIYTAYILSVCGLTPLINTNIPIVVEDRFADAAAGPFDIVTRLETLFLLQLRRLIGTALNKLGFVVHYPDRTEEHSPVLDIRVRTTARETLRLIDLIEDYLNSLKLYARINGIELSIRNFYETRPYSIWLTYSMDEWDGLIIRIRLLPPLGLTRFFRQEIIPRLSSEGYDHFSIILPPSYSKVEGKVAKGCPVTMQFGDLAPLTVLIYKLALKDVTATTPWGTFNVPAFGTDGTLRKPCVISYMHDIRNYVGRDPLGWSKTIIPAWFSVEP